MKKIAVFLLFSGLCLLTSCQSSKLSMKALIKDVESYHHDLLFERYEIAAKNIAPESRASWLESMQSQKLHFAEIEIASYAPCASGEIVNKEEQDRCAVIISQVEWYANGSPSVHSARVYSTWQYNKDAKRWLIVEQEQR